jgi:hypothetical protein
MLGLFWIIHRDNFTRSFESILYLEEEDEEVFNREGRIVTNYGITSRTWIENANDRKGMFRFNF